MLYVIHVIGMVHLKNILNYAQLGKYVVVIIPFVYLNFQLIKEAQHISECNESLFICHNKSCNLYLNPQELKKHLDECILRNVGCLNCKWSGIYKDFYNHVCILIKCHGIVMKYIEKNINL